MNVAARVASEDQLVRLLQVGVVLEEVFEARANHHYRNLSEADREAVDDAVVDLLTEATEESAEHRRRLGVTPRLRLLQAAAPTLVEPRT